MKKFLISTFLTAIVFVSAFSQIPTGYYDPAQGLTGTPLRQALHTIIDNHSVKSYSSLWTHFQNTDKKTNGKVWDMYSDNPGGTPPYEFTFSSDQCGNYSGESDCYNREHSWPKSWFNDLAPMESDLFHLYPTDGYVNNIRGNYPYGEVSNPNYTSQNGGKRGPNTFPGYTGTVFEPINEYKGDFARTYFYMCTRYYTEDAGWDVTDMTDKANLKAWALDLMKKWNEQDPVSAKEVARNNAVYAIQGNRNPFIDHPEYACVIWPGGSYCTAGGPTTVSVSTVSSTSYCVGDAINISFTVTGTINTGNTYSLQLSDSTGNFATPTVIGSLTSTSLSGTINTIIPANTHSGNAYRVRVNASNPATTGNTNATNIAIHLLPVAKTHGSGSEICNGESLSIAASGGNSYTWSTGDTTANIVVTPDTTTTYSVTVKNVYGCEDTANAVIIVKPNPTPAISQMGTLLTSSIAEGNQWYLNGNPIQQENDPTYTVGSIGDYYTIVTHANFCVSDTSNTITITNLGVTRNNDLHLQIAPNPNNGIFNITFENPSNSPSTLKIMNELGQLVFDHNYSSSEKNIAVDLNELPKGIYVACLSSGIYFTSKLIAVGY
jgi:endonuclease I